MAHGKIRVNTLTYDTGSGDVDVAVSNIATGTVPSNTDSEIDARITAATGVSVQAADPDTAKTDVTQTFTKAQRGDIVDVTGTTFSIDLNAGNNFKFTTSGNWTSFCLENLATAAEGQTGSIFIVYGGAHSGSYHNVVCWWFRWHHSYQHCNGIDRIDYIVLNSTTLTCNFTANYE